MADILQIARECGCTDIGGLRHMTAFTLEQLTAFAARIRAEAEKDAQRYRTVRRMNVAQFRDAFVLNIRTGKPFDEIVDDLAPFIAAAIRAQSNAGD